MHIHLDKERQTVVSDRCRTVRGGIAQLGERLNGIQEVSGSIPLTSTNKYFKGLWNCIHNPFFLIYR